MRGEDNGRGQLQTAAISFPALFWASRSAFSLQVMRDAARLGMRVGQQMTAVPSPGALRDEAICHRLRPRAILQALSGITEAMVTSIPARTSTSEMQDVSIELRASPTPPRRSSMVASARSSQSFLFARPKKKLGGWKLEAWRRSILGHPSPSSMAARRHRKQLGDALTKDSHAFGQRALVTPGATRCGRFRAGLAQRHDEHRRTSSSTGCSANYPSRRAPYCARGRRAPYFSTGGARPSALYFGTCRARQGWHWTVSRRRWACLGVVHVWNPLDSLWGCSCRGRRRAGGGRGNSGVKGARMIGEAAHSRRATTDDASRPNSLAGPGGCCVA